MKILVSFEDRIRVDSTGVYYLKAFRDLGHEVDHVLPEKIKDVHGGYDLYFKCDDGLQSEWNKELHPSVYQVIDTHIESDWRVKLASEGEFDLVAVAQKEGLNLPWTNKKVIWGPLGCDMDLHYVGPREKKYDAAIIMNFHSQYAAKRIELVHSLLAAVPNFFFGGRMFKEMAEKFAESKIVFNSALNGDLNMRAAEGPCSGSMLLTDDIPTLKYFFTDGVHVVAYKNEQEMKEKALYYLSHDDERENIAKAGHEHAIKYHTYKKRAEEILHYAGFGPSDYVPGAWAIPCGDEKRVEPASLQPSSQGDCLTSPH